jgi:hypothetical protein
MKLLAGELPPLGLRQARRTRQSKNNRALKQDFSQRASRHEKRRSQPTAESFHNPSGNARVPDAAEPLINEPFCTLASAGSSEPPPPRRPRPGQQRQHAAPLSTTTGVQNRSVSRLTTAHTIAHNAASSDITIVSIVTRSPGVVGGGSSGSSIGTTSSCGSVVPAPLALRLTFEECFHFFDCDGAIAERRGQGDGEQKPQHRGQGIGAGALDGLAHYPLRPAPPRLSVCPK